MKNLKKVLALAVAFVMCFTMFAGAAVYSDVPAGSDYSEAVSLLSDLGIIAGMPDGSFGVDKTITRADAACLIARMLTGETMPSKYAGASNFVDVPKSAYYESAVAYCAIMGITSGTSATAGTYSPSREITDGEFIAMITRALGYDSAANPLQFPMGNVARAQQEGILDGVNVEVSSPALRGEDAMMIYNALFADYDAYAKQQNIYQSADDQVEYTIAHEVFSLDRLAVSDKDEVKYKDEIEDGKDKCVAHQWVVVGVDPRDKANTYTAFPIDDRDKDLKDLRSLNDPKHQGDLGITFVYEGDAASIMGYEVELWGDDDHTGTEHDIVAVKTVKGQTAYDWNISMGEDGADELTVDSDKTVDAEEAFLAVGNTLEKDDGDLLEGVHINPDLDEDAYLIVDFDEYSDEQWKNKDGDSYRLFDWNSDGDIDFALKTIRKYGIVTDKDSKDISIKSVEDDVVIEEDLEIDADQLKINCTDIEEDDVVEMTYSRAYSASEKGEVVTVDMKKVTSDIKQLTKVSTKGDLEMTFDGDVYKYASDEYGWDLCENEDNKLDEDDLEGNYELWLDANGYIVKIDESDNNTGYLVALRLEDGYKELSKNRSTRASMKVKLDDNTVDVYDVAYDLQITGSVADTIDPKDKKTVVDKDRDIQTITNNEANGLEIKPGSVDDRVNINGTKGNYVFYDKDYYVWNNENRIVGQVYKYWMDSDKVITKLERVAQTVDTYSDYFDNTGVVNVGGNKQINGKKTYNGETFNGNVYLKNSKVLFVTDYDFVSTETIRTSSYDAHEYVVADEDKVLAIEPNTANLRAIDPARYGDCLADSDATTKSCDEAGNKKVGTTKKVGATAKDEWQKNWYEDDAKGSVISGVGPQAGAGLYAATAVVGATDASTNTAMIAYDIDENYYASAAIMTIGNFPDFDKTKSVALITDVDAVNRKNTVFTIYGVVDGQEGPFTTVEADDVGDIFKFWGATNEVDTTDAKTGKVTATKKITSTIEGAFDDANNVPRAVEVWDKADLENTDKRQVVYLKDEIPYESVTQIRNDIDEKAVYAEITRDASGKVTKVVVMSPEQEIMGGVAGPDKMVIRLALGNKPERTDSSVSYAAGYANGDNIMVYHDKKNMYQLDNIQWHTSFDVTGSTKIYQITNSVEKIIGVESDKEAGLKLETQNGFKTDPDLKVGALADIAVSKTRENITTDKYAIADVAFAWARLADRATGWRNNLGQLNGKDSVAIFTYNNGRFGQVDPDEKLPVVTVVDTQNGSTGKVDGKQQVTTIEFTGGNGSADGSDHDVELKVGEISVPFTIKAGDTAPIVKTTLKNALEKSAVADDFEIVDLDAGDGIKLTAKKRKAHVAVSMPVADVKEGKSIDAATRLYDTLTVKLTKEIAGVADETEEKDAIIKLDVSGCANVALTDDNGAVRTLTVTLDAVKDDKTFPVAVVVKFDDANLSDAELAKLVAEQFDKWPSVKADYANDGTVTVEYLVASDENLDGFTGTFVWKDKVDDEVGEVKFAVDR